MELSELMEKQVFHPAFLLDQNGNTIFHAGAQQGQKKVCKAAVRYGAQLNAQNNSGNTALHYLLCFGYVELADYFIKKGCDSQIRNKNGFLPMDRKL